MELRVLAVGDVVGSAGVAYLAKQLRNLKKDTGTDFCIVNGENSSITGITPDQAEEIFRAGADVITLGNHTFGRREICRYLDDCRYILRPGNYSPNVQGCGWQTYETKAGPVTVANLVGRCGMDFVPDNPFFVADRIVKYAEGMPLILDFHAEATSEKLAMAWYLDGKAAAVFGTHTHVQTADEQILPKGTGYISDLGMTGPRRSVLGIRPEQSIAKFRGDLTSRYEQAPGSCMLSGALFTLDYASGTCLKAERILIHD